MFNEVLLMHLLSTHNYGYNSEYENLSDEEKAYMDYVDKCMMSDDEMFSNAVTRIMLLILEVSSKMGTPKELTDEEVRMQKQTILAPFSEEDKQKLESFMYAVIQTMGIYSEERVTERKLKKKGND